MEKKSNKKILIIEDDQSLASAYRIKLSPYFATQNAITGDEGLKSASDWQPDLIILDLFLPGKSGQEVLKDLKKHAKTKRIPVIVLTNLEGQCEKMLEGGAADCMIKTEMSMEEILKKIKSHL
ncbi:response regulator transcription factor [Candidatus Roizmanbacteria bacterium]|nr:response regulator transcription factor [Candidatus Roizmanbacteria bacterium]